MMNSIIHNRLYISLTVFILLFIFCLPLYNHVFDVDGIGYIGAAKQYAAGNLQLAVNGYWSPLHSWIVVPFIKWGLLPEDAFRYSNGIIGVGSLIVLHQLLRRFDLKADIQTAILFTSVLILLQFSFYELAADMLLVFMLLLLFNLVLHPNFYSSTALNVAAGIIGAFAFFAKSYAFPFFIIYFILLHLFLNPNKSKKIYFIFIGLSVFFLFSFPWIYALHWKYGEWMIAHGKNNYGNWDQQYRDLSGPLLIAPPYVGSPAVWEDPWKLEQLNFKQASITSIILHQIRIVLFNLQQWFTSLHELSFLSSGILFISVIAFLKNRNPRWIFFFLTISILSAGYLLFHIETRFIWSLVFLLLIAGTMLLTKLLQWSQLPAWQNRLVWFVFFGSFLVEPVNGLKDNLHKNDELYRTAEKIKIESIQGSFTSNKKQDECMVLAYLTGNSFYTITKPSYTLQQLMVEMEQQKLRYYFYYYDAAFQKEEFLHGQIAKKAQLIKELQPGLLAISFY